MSARPTPSPRQGLASAGAEETEMPKGHCRYILLQDEIKGQRCACVNFVRNLAVPGTTCDCGHLACFHSREQEHLGQKQELEQLKRRLQVLEAQISLRHDEVLDKVVSRVAEVEDNLDRSKEEVEAQIKGAYQNLHMAWDKIVAGDEKQRQADSQLRQIYGKLMTHEEKISKMEDRQMELQDADLSIEERIGHLYDTLDDNRSFSSTGEDNQRRRRYMSDLKRPVMSSSSGPLGDTSQPPRARPAEHPIGRPGNASASNPSGRVMPAWTVHVSLLPQASIAMPFEKNTNAYQRCLSRGLHRMIVVAGTDAPSFVDAVSKAFSSILRGRKWMPLEAKLCDAESLQGLPMLCQLDPSIVDGPYDVDFLRRNCAVCDGNGTLDSIYIAMCNGTISWHSLKQSPVVTEGLEGSWTHDPLLDNDPYDDDTAIDDGERPAAGDFVPGFSSLKRTASEISRSNCFEASSAARVDEQGTEAKRTCPAPPFKRKGVETT